ncbi:GNAT family N-acetyltransferase [Rhodococcus sp. NPDC003994]
MAPIVLRTERLTLRPYARTDVDDVLAYYSRPGVCRYLLHEPMTRSDAEATVEKRSARTALTDGAVALVAEHDGRVVGNVDAWTVDDSPALVELGWTFSPEVGGRGLATEAVRALLDHVFGHDVVHRVTARMDGRNTSSAKLAERVRMQREAYFRQDWWSKGEWTDTAVYAMLRSDRGPGLTLPLHP